MHLVSVPKALKDPPLGISLRYIMTLPDGKADFQHPQFFVSQAEKLNALLEVVVNESKDAVNPEALVDYLELTGILTDLLDNARFYGILTPEQLQLREPEVRSFLTKIRSVQETVGDWDVRTKKIEPTTSRKRARSTDLEEETMSAMSSFKRRRETGSSEQDMVAEAAINSPFATVLPSIEKSPTPWWTEPLYD